MLSYCSNEVEITHTLIMQVLCIDKIPVCSALMDDYKVMLAILLQTGRGSKRFCICVIRLSDYWKVQPVL